MAEDPRMGGAGLAQVEEAMVRANAPTGALKQQIQTKLMSQEYETREGHVLRDLVRLYFRKYGEEALQDLVPIIEGVLPYSERGEQTSAPAGGMAMPASSPSQPLPMAPPGSAQPPPFPTGPGMPGMMGPGDVAAPPGPTMPPPFPAPAPMNPAEMGPQASADLLDQMAVKLKR